MSATLIISNLLSFAAGWVANVFYWRWHYRSLMKQARWEHDLSKEDAQLKAMTERVEKAKQRLPKEK